MVINLQKPQTEPKTFSAWDQEPLLRIVRSADFGGPATFVALEAARAAKVCCDFVPNTIGFRAL